jgi:hypothetical protein
MGEVKQPQQDLNTQRPGNLNPTLQQTTTMCTRPPQAPPYTYLAQSLTGRLTRNMAALGQLQQGGC